MKILITGGNGYIAKALSKGLWKGTDRNDITSITRNDFDLTDRESTNKWFSNKKFDVVIHTAISGGSRLKKDNSSIFYQNLQMFYNLLNNKKHFNKFIHFGSGAELGMPDDPYGLSKNIINEIAEKEKNFYNIRIYGVFDENELNTRFIKANLRRYLCKQPIEIHQDKKMDLIYMKDLIKLVQFYLDNNNLPKIIDCSYKKHYYLSDIANIINNLSNHKVKINIGKGKGKNYIGNYNPIFKNYRGLESGIKEVYNKLK